MNIETVNELIASLESAGELSIRELAKAYQQLAAENVALKAGVTYFAYSPEYGFDYFKDKQSAIDTAQAEIDAYREDADDGWSEDVQRVSWGIVIQQAQGFDAQGLHTSDSRHTYQTCNYRLVDSVETPVTDAYLAGIKADAITASLDACSDYLETDCVMDRLDISYEEAEKRTSGAIEFHDAMVDFANQLREEADK
ncbi:TPA: hypothetical protein NBM22_000434 [Klebsiella pneumoniae]|uniref:hypothetical protein n=1 Tax=Klebsiella sp. GG_Kp177 TaxID=3153488 RepID=UPI0009420637|nr:hypothetical protein [Klebsiella pneumoniae]MCB3295454.1 hypothetical protein [Klebsiella pneumoniae]MCS6688327.1 hypothetical protein [Klebsiella pneumoniae subsp. pneumoniae]MEA4457021.1 hypothetical protein [Klebsiella pneumoniae]WLY35712.1 hypothetical protein RA204_11570 [Klebsiella pneumoniae]HBQ1206965.1 hypothetical protein [Klebsiella pneumoniae]